MIQSFDEHCNLYIESFECFNLVNKCEQNLESSSESLTFPFSPQIISKPSGTETKKFSTVTLAREISKKDRSHCSNENT